MSTSARCNWRGARSTWCTAAPPPFPRPASRFARWWKTASLSPAAPPTPWPAEDGALHALITEAFNATYLERFRRPPPAVAIDLVHARVVLRGAKGSVGTSCAKPRWSGPAAAHQREVLGDGTRGMADIYSRGGLLPGFSAPGPALVEEAGSTLVIGPGGRFTVLDSGNILVEVG